MYNFENCIKQIEAYLTDNRRNDGETNSVISATSTDKDFSTDCVCELKKQSTTNSSLIVS